jgi:hypothetical protein
VRKLAREADIIDWRDEDGDQHVEQMIDLLMVIWQAACAQALEDAAIACERLAREDYGMVNSLHEYGECAQLIRALKGKQ